LAGERGAVTCWLGRRSEAWASHRTPTCPALSGSYVLSNRGAAKRDLKSL